MSPPEKFSETNSGFIGEEEKLEEFLAARFSDENGAFKVRKIDLLKEAELPIPTTEVFNANDFIGLKEAIINRRTEDAQSSLIVRFACIPDKFSMASLFIESESNIDDAIMECKSIMDGDHTIKQVILQEATPKSKMKDKVSGRLLFEDAKDNSPEEVLELYKGARSTNVLNSADVDSPNFLHLEKYPGQFMRSNPQSGRNTSFSESELRDLYSTLSKFRENMDLVRRVIAKSRGKKINDIIVSFEFSYNKGKMIFSDID